MKRFLLLLLLLLSTPTHVLGATDESMCSNNKELISQKVKDEMEDYQIKEADIQEKYMIDVIEGLFDFAGVNSLQNLVFGNPYCVWNDDGNVTYGLFTNAELDTFLKPTIQTLSSTFVVAVTLAIMLHALKFSTSGLTGRTKAEFWEFTKMLVLSAMFISLYWLFFNLLFELNASIVETVKNMLENNGVDYKGFSVIASISLKSFPDILTIFAEWMLAAYLNFVYIARKIMITFLIILGPFAAMSLVLQSTRSFFGVWMKELLGLVFLPSIHAFILYAFTNLAVMASGLDSFIFKIGLLIMFIPLTNLITGWLHLGNTSHGLAMGTVSSIINSLSQLERLRQGGSNHEQPNISKQSGDSAKTGISELATGQGSEIWQTAKKAGSRLGGIAGMAGGAIFGPKGVAVGKALGEKAVPQIMQGTRNVGAGLYSLGKTINDAHKNGTLKSSVSNLQDKRNLFGNVGEAIGSIVGAGVEGRAIGHFSSGVSRNKLFLGDTAKGGYGGMSLQNLAEAYPGAELTFKQDNMHSAFFMGDRQVSPSGPADPNLGKGETRTIGYQLSNSSPLNMQPSGTFTAAPLNGGTPYLERTTGAQIQDSNGNYFQDGRFNPSSLNPDSYFSEALKSKGNPVASGHNPLSNNQLNGWQETAQHNQGPRKRQVL